MSSMLRSYFFVVACSLCVCSLFVAKNVSAASVSWDGGGDGVSWESANNWSGDLAPGVDDDVTIDATVTVNLSASTTINSLVLGNVSGTTAAVLNFNYNAVGGAPLNIDDGNLTIYAGSTITHTAGTSIVVGSVSINIITGNANILGDINVDYKGYAPAYGPGFGVSNSTYGGGGGGHGGNGAGSYTYPNSIGSFNDSLVEPVFLGSGGGNGTQLGGYGGGAVKIVVNGAMQLNGIISADGQEPVTAASQGGGGGSGGSVIVYASDISGNGIISANGGNGDSATTDGGGGGGGRIAVYYTSNASSIEYQTYGGIGPDDAGEGAAGTIYLKPSGGDAILMLVNPNNVVPQVAKTGDVTASITFATVTINATPVDIYSPTFTTPTLTVSNYGEIAFVSNSVVVIDTITAQSGGEFSVGAGSSVTYITLNWSNAGVLTDNGGTFSWFSSGGDLVVPATCTYNANVPRTFNSVTVNGTISHSANASSKVYYIDLTTSGNFLINAGGEINVSGKGYARESGIGAGTLNGSGGGHGGDGGVASVGSGGGAGLAYGSLVTPNTLGSGGDSSNGRSGGAGGGAVKLSVAGELENSGAIYANGFNGALNGGGGAGGSIWLNANVLDGAGVIYANGGIGGYSSSDFYDGGGGGGGRIAIYYNSSTSSMNYQAYGGNGYDASEDGAAGTIYIKPVGAHATFIARNQNSMVPRVAKTGAIVSDDTFDLVIINAAFIDVTSTMFSAQNLTVDNFGKMVFTNNVNANIVNVIAQNNGNVWVDSGSSLNYANLDWSNYGILTDNGGTLLPFSGGGDLVIPVNAVYNANVPRTFNSITVNGTISHAANGASKSYYIDLTSNSYLTINGGGAINVDNKGFAASEGPGQGIDNTCGSGAGYAGSGGNSSNGTLGGGQYGSSILPTDLGSGGGTGGLFQLSLGGAGGGGVRLNVSTSLTNNGLISANGGAGTGIYHASGGGSGGSVLVISETLLGNGIVRANGGDGGSFASSSEYGGGGAGGRIAIYYCVNSSTITTQAIGGVGPNTATDGAVGTIYTEQINKAPNAPTGLSPIAIVTGGTTSNAAPTFNFTLSDNDVADTVSYRVQIDDIYDFSSPVVNYTSALQAQGSASFTVGQAAEGGVYTVGSESQIFSPGSYYLRVATVDDSGSVSSYNVANSGGVAFVVDTVSPQVITVGSTASNSVYKAGDFITITVVFNDVVVVTGMPVISLNSGGSATYSTGSGTSSLTFSYTVITGENSADLDYTSTNALSLNSGTIKDGAGNNAVLTLATPGTAGSISAVKSIVIDALAPAAPVITAPSAGATVNTLPTISGTSEASANVEVFCNGVSLGTTVANVSGAWSFVVGTDLSEGARQFKAQAIDGAGNVGALSNGVNVTIKGDSEEVDPEPTPEPMPEETPTYSIRGIIELDSVNRSGLSGVSVSLYSNDVRLSRVESNGDGEFVFSGIEAESYEISFYKAGYEFADMNLPVVVSSENVSGISTTATRARSNVQWGAYNGYLDMLNVLELTNASDIQNRVIVDVFDADGGILDTVEFNISAYGQRDIIINDLAHFSKDTVGLLRVVSLSDGISGRMSVYRRDGDNSFDNGFEFSFNQPLGVVASSKTYVSFNGMQPSRVPVESENIVAQWLTLANLTSEQKRFWVRTYSIDGALLMTRLVSVPGYGRRDVEGNAITALASKVGYHEVEPEISDTEYFAYLLRYGTNTQGNVAPTAYSFVLSLMSSYADTKHLYVPISYPQNSLNWLELINTAGHTESVNIKYYDGTGNKVNEETLTMRAHTQTHINASEYLPLYGAGLTHIEASKSDVIVARSIVYAYGASGGIDAVYLREAIEPTSARLGEMFNLSGTYNLYINMTNWLTLTNITSEPVTLNLYMRSSSGLESYTESLRIMPHGTSVYPLHLESTYGLHLDTYGIISINTDTTGAILSDVIRARPNGSNGWDFVSSNAVR